MHVVSCVQKNMAAFGDAGAAPLVPPNQTVYVNNLNEKITVEGTTSATKPGADARA
jgi:hypothetical protein